MNHVKSVSMRSRPTASHVILSLACGVLASACSGYYELGETVQPDQTLPVDSTPTGSVAVSNADVSGLLAPPDFSFETSDTAGPGTVAGVGDLDGDGYGDMAEAGSDFSTGLSFVHVRYGGPRPRDAVEQLAFAENGARLALEGTVNVLSVARAGDVDADGYDDLLIRSSDCTTTEPGNGTFLVYGGPERLQGTVSLTQTAVHIQSLNRVGVPDPAMACGSAYAVGPGDLDGDGIDDFLITYQLQVAQHPLSVPNDGEGVYVFYGRSERFSGEVPLADADAVLHVSPPSDADLVANPNSQRVDAYSVGDVNGDGRADLFVGADYAFPPVDSFLVPGRTERWSGRVELPTVATLLKGVYVDQIERGNGAGDLDGDGISDLVLSGEASGNLYVFYGKPQLFEQGIDLAEADAVLENRGLVFPIGDRDGDGDDELLDLFEVPKPSFVHPNDVALESGSRERLSGTVVLPGSQAIAQTRHGYFTADPHAILTSAIPAGDLDGDGAADLFTTSESRIADGSGSWTAGAHQLHIHYGTLGGANPPAAPSTPLH